MVIKINSKKMIEGEKPVFDLQEVSPITLKTDQDFQSLSSSLYLAGSRVYGNSNKLLFLSKQYTINEDEITFNVDTYTENYLKYINEFRTPFNLEFGAFSNSKKVFLLDKAFANPRVYLEGTPPIHIDDYYTKDEIDSILSTNYWTKYEVAQAIAEIQTMDIEVLSALPPIEEAKEYTIYLVPSQDQEQGNVYDEYLVINGAYECIGSTAVDLSQYATKDSLSAYLQLSGGNVEYLSINNVDVIPSSYAKIDDLSGYLPLSGGTLSGELTLSDIGLSFNYGGWYWNINKFGNIFKGGAYQTVIHNQDIEIEGRPDTGCKINLNPVSGHLQYRGNNENTPGGFVIQDLSGNISISGDILKDGVSYDSIFLKKFENFSLPSSGQEYLTQINVGGRNAISIYAGAGGYGYYTYIGSMYGFADIKGIAINLSYSGYLGLNGHHENTPGGFVIQDLSGKISAPYIEAVSGYVQDGINYSLASLEKKITPETFTSASLSAQSDKFYQSNDDLTSLDLTITSGLTNSMIFFTTGNSFTFTSTIDEGMYLNEPFDFAPSGAYLIAIENKCIVWSQMFPK